MTNREAFCALLAWSEGTSTIPGSDRGYDVLVGGTLFTTGYADHPRVKINLGHGLNSTAAGRYQILAHWFDAYKQYLKLPDFSPASQDAIALQMIGECKALDDIDAGNIASAITKCASRWASLPGAGYGQRENTIEGLMKIYQESGGVAQVST